MFRRVRDTDEARSFAPIDPGAVREHRRWFVALGIASALLGILAILLPLFASLVTAIALGWLMLIAGLLEGYHALKSPGGRGAGWEIASAVVQVVAGLLVVAFPVVGKLALTLVFAWYFIAEGCIKLSRTGQHRRVQGGGWLLLDGVFSLGLGILILAHWPAVAVWVFGVFVGASLIMGGASMLLIGLGARREAPM